MEDRELIEQAKKASGHSYSPYSNFAVGAALLLVDGQVVLGTNVENAAYGSTICAERNALGAAISNGFKPCDIKALAIYHDGEKIIRPCGACLQVMAELMGQDGLVIMSSNQGYEKLRVKDLMPYAFSKEDIDV